MRSYAWLAVATVAALALAGCAGSTPAPTSNVQPAATYEVKVMKSHALQSKSQWNLRTELVQGGSVVGSGSFTISKTDSQDPQTAYSKTLPGGPIQLKVFEGSNPVGTKTLDPAKCPKPLEFELHVVDDAVHTYSNCD
ncbi:MAG: hypothetical protein AABX89_07600 [Candidatus Thermoplasmatota archaeon]